jgi:hypothetical protein
MSKEKMNERIEQKKKLIEMLEEKIQERSVKNQEKLYIVEGGKDAAYNALKFITNSAEWKFSEAMGVIEANRAIKEAIANIEDGKTSEFYLKNLTLEAIYYFMTKVTGSGLGEALQFYAELLKPMSEALARAKADKDVLDKMMRDQGTLHHSIEVGASIENEDEIVKEIVNELEAELAEA